MSGSVTPASVASPTPHDEDDHRAIHEGSSVDVGGTPVDHMDVRPESHGSTDADMDMPISASINHPPER